MKKGDQVLVRCGEYKDKTGEAVSSWTMVDKLCGNGGSVRFSWFVVFNDGSDGFVYESLLEIIEPEQPQFKSAVKEPFFHTENLQGLD